MISSICFSLFSFLFFTPFSIATSVLPLFVFCFSFHSLSSYQFIETTHTHTFRFLFHFVWLHLVSNVCFFLTSPVSTMITYDPLPFGFFSILMCTHFLHVFLSYVLFRSASRFCFFSFNNFGLPLCTEILYYTLQLTFRLIFIVLKIVKHEYYRFL